MGASATVRTRGPAVAFNQVAGASASTVSATTAWNARRWPRRVRGGRSRRTACRIRRTCCRIRRADCCIRRTGSGSRICARPAPRCRSRIRSCPSVIPQAATPATGRRLHRRPGIVAGGDRVPERKPP
ncbi:hypothetical protein Stsp01_06580 [Streptomyces sp. NBRC 13847]|nr:hypothetical protein Stsp01_06580 [Streptomyces sp. NBRC 13847]